MRHLPPCSDILAFATEPVTACLANVLGNVSNFKASLPADVKVQRWAVSVNTFGMCIMSV